MYATWLLKHVFYAGTTFRRQASINKNQNTKTKAKKNMWFYAK